MIESTLVIPLFGENPIVPERTSPTGTVRRCLPCASIGMWVLGASRQGDKLASEKGKEIGRTLY